MLLKICGITREEDAWCAASCGNATLSHSKTSVVTSNRCIAYRAGEEVNVSCEAAERPAEAPQLVQPFIRRRR